MFKFEEICELIQLVGSSGVSSVELEHAGTRLKIDGRPSAPSVAVAPAQAPPVAPAPGAAVPQAGTPDVTAPVEGDDGEEGLQFVASPIVGTFYRAPNPDADPYVKVGDAVDRGQVLCIVEAMKLMNEIESDVAGTVVKVLADNAEPVEFGQRLFAIRPAE